MARPAHPEHIHLRSARMLDVVAGELVSPGDLLIGATGSSRWRRPRCPTTPCVIDLGDVTLLPGLMDMEVNLLLGGPDHRSPLNAVQDDPALRTLRCGGQRPTDPPGRVHHGPQPRVCSSRPAACSSMWPS